MQNTEDKSLHRGVQLTVIASRWRSKGCPAGRRARQGYSHQLSVYGLDGLTVPFIGLYCIDLVLGTRGVIAQKIFPRFPARISLPPQPQPLPLWKRFQALLLRCHR